MKQSGLSFLFFSFHFRFLSSFFAYAFGFLSLKVRCFAPFLSASDCTFFFCLLRALAAPSCSGSSSISDDSRKLKLTSKSSNFAGRFLSRDGRSSFVAVACCTKSPCVRVITERIIRGRRKSLVISTHAFLSAKALSSALKHNAAIWNGSPAPLMPRLQKPSFTACAFAKEAAPMMMKVLQ